MSGISYSINLTHPGL